MRITLFVALSIFLIQCKSTQVIKDNTCRDLIKSNEITPTISTIIESVELDGDCLTLNIEAQACSKKTEDFDLKWNGKVMKSSPPQVNLSLDFQSSQECSKKYKYQLKYDISQLKSINSRGQVIVRLVGYDDRIDYKY